VTIQCDGENLKIAELTELALANSASISRQLLAALPVGVKSIAIDLSQTDYMDCAGLGALVSLHKAARNLHQGVELKLLNPPPPIQQMFELTKMNHFFQLTH
jgi:anti-sigma B factor antagonist